MKIILLFSAWLFFWQPAVAFVNSDSTESQPDSDVHYLSKNNRIPLFELSIWGGYAFDSFTLWGKTTDATLGIMGFNFKRKFLKIYGAIIEYSGGVSLYARYTYPQFTVGRERTSLNGFGITPLGLQTNFITNRNMQPFLNISAGVMFLEKPFPDYRGKRLNYTFSVGTGLEFEITRSASLSLGYKYVHLSNGETGEVNPGIDSSLLYTSFTFNI